MKKKLISVVIAMALVSVMALHAFAAGGDVATVIQSTWSAAAAQIKSVVNNVVFPALDVLLSIAFFVKLGTAYFDFRKHGQMEWAPPIILFVCLVFTITAPSFIWSIAGI